MSLEEIKIRSMREEDLETVIEIEVEGDLDQWGNQFYLENLKNKDSLLYVAEKNVEIVGFVSARLITSVVEIFNVAVKNDFRKQGIGKQLLTAVLRDATEKNCENCWLEVRESNIAARRFYEKLNFEIVGRRKKYYNFPNEDALLLEYKIKTEPCLDNPV